MIYFVCPNLTYRYSLIPLYKVLKAEKYEVLWGRPETEIGSDDLQVTCLMPNPKKASSWKRCVFIHHSVSEYFPYGGDLERWPHQFERVFSVGMETHVKIKKHPICLPQNVRMIGWPKGDILFNSEKEEREEQLRECLNLPYEKTVLITCASQGHLKWEKPILNEVIPLSKGKFNVLVKERGSRYTKLFSDKENVRHISNTEDVTPFYLITDLLLSIHPASSTLIEIAQVNKPSITVNFGDENWIKRWRYTFLGEADTFCKLDELNSNIVMLLRDSEEYSPEIREKLEKFIYKPDGHATERGVRELKELIR